MKVFHIILSCTLYILSVQSHYKNDPIVSSPWGDVQGGRTVSRRGATIYFFKGIPYAKPPINELRFKPPVPIEKVKGVFDATKDGPSCPQPSNDVTSEDCLILNVYTTKLPDGKNNPKRPVIVHIHAGGFYSATSVSYWAGPQYFMDQDIVLVTFNYRLGSLGFLSTGDKEAPGNNGLKDQVVVLKWIQKNIESFGGDPNSVTIQGYSAGGWSVVLHMVSPMSKGLFHKAVAMSGSPVGIWPIPNNQTDIAKKQARILGCPDNTSSAEIIKCLRTKSAQDFGNSLFQFREFGTNILLIWSPVIEPDVGEPRFLTDHPIRLITKGQFHQVPFICGRTTVEFGYFASHVLNNSTLTKQLNDNFEEFAPITLLYERNTDFSKSVSRSIKKFYLHDKIIDKSQEIALGQLYEDAIVGFQMHRIVKLIAEYSKCPVYYYQFSYPGFYSHAYVPGTNNTVKYGVVHHDDLIYLFYISRLFPEFGAVSPKDIEMVDKLTTLYANFAKTGNPTPGISFRLDYVKWDPYKLTEQKYLDIGDLLVIKEKLNENRFKFWEELYPLSLYLQ